MIKANNITLIKPKIIFKTDTLRENKEIISLICFIRSYFQQKNIIHDCELTLTNNEYETIQGKHGHYKKRINTTFQIRHLKKMILYDEHIDFHILNNDTITTHRIKISKNFLYILECEDDY